MKKIEVKCLVTLAGVFLMAAGEARNLLWRGGEGDSFTDGGKWYVQDSLEVAGTPPGPGDKIVVGDTPFVIDVSDAEDLAVVNGCDGVFLPEKDSECRIVVPENADAVITVPIVGGYESGSGSGGKGKVFISGPGKLSLTSTNRYDYCHAQLTIDGTDLWLPQDDDLQLSSCPYGVVTMTNNATLHLPTCHNGDLNTGGNYVSMQRLCGDGTVVAAEATELRFSTLGGVFAGVIGKNIRLFQSGQQFLTGTNSTMNGTIRVYGAKDKWSTYTGVLGVKKFGMSGKPSSIGTYGDFRANVQGGTYLYLGEGEETDKTFLAYPAPDGYNVLDGGAYGGLVFTASGGIGNLNSAHQNNCVVGLSGSNTVPCVIRGEVNESTVNHTYLISIVKKGTGTWHFADPVKEGLDVWDGRRFKGTISVDEGVLKFDTIAPPGEYCSVGAASLRKGPYLGAWASMPDQDWAFSLGGVPASLKGLAEGTLEYTGEQAGLADRRKVRLEADGRLRANGPKRIRYCMAAPVTERAKTLSLDGVSMATNEVHDITDTAEYPVSVVKEGSGTWLLGGEQSFHGDLKVKGGKLIVQNFAAGGNYTWFRLTVKDLFDPVLNEDGTPLGNKSCVSIRFLGLYDADGQNQTFSLRESEGMTAASLEPGQAGYGTSRQHSRGSYLLTGWNDDNITNLFSNLPDTVFDTRMKSVTGEGNDYPRLDDELTWLPLVMRLTNGTPAIASFDWANTYGWNEGNRAGFHWTPRVYSLEGSLDGIHWENVKTDGGDYVLSTNDCVGLQTGGWFIYSGLQLRNEARTGPQSPYVHSDGCSIRGVSTNSFAALPNVRSVQVDSGAVLEFEGEFPAIDDLTVDASKGGGTIKGAAFAEDGTIRLLNHSADAGQCEVAVDLSGTSGSGNFTGWSVSMDGVSDSFWFARYSDGKLKISPPGLRVIFR